ncbi:MAG TPA: hypothetical protein VEY70_25565 [Metabacillus sp.]|nr:hypothetical protein [Metabacillus sp.]
MLQHNSEGEGGECDTKLYLLLSIRSGFVHDGVEELSQSLQNIIHTIGGAI